MNTPVIYYPDKASFDASVAADDPLLLLVTFDGSEIVVSGADQSVEHVVLLRLIGRKETDIDQFFRVVVNKTGADWTFVCPEGYKGIADRTRRIERFYNDGHDLIRNALKAIGYDVPIDIPKRYKRHFKELTDFQGPEGASQ